MPAKGNDNVRIFNSSGVLQAILGSSGSANGQFATPTGITIDSANAVYVGEINNYRVQKFTEN